MPQYNDGITSKNRYRKKRVKKSGKITRSDVKSLAKEAVINLSEKKHFDIDITGLNIGSASAGTPVVQSLCNISQGNGENERGGNHVRPVYLGGRYSITGVNNAGSRVTRVRVCVVRYKPNTAQAGEPSMGTLLANQSRPFSFNLTNQSKQYDVLFNAMHYIVNTSSNEAFTVVGQWNRDNLEGKDISFNDASTQGESKLYLLVISDYNNVDNGFPTLTADIRMKYMDY